MVLAVVCCCQQTGVPLFPTQCVGPEPRLFISMLWAFLSYIRQEGTWGQTHTEKENRMEEIRKGGREGGGRGGRLWTNKSILQWLGGCLSSAAQILTRRPQKVDDQSCRRRLKEYWLHLCLGVVMKVCIANGCVFTQCEKATAPKLDFVNGDCGLV